jgi:beta-galactosidase
LTHWQEPNARRNGSALAKTLEYMFDMNANVDFYMYFGGTNFGFWAGANDWGIGEYMADITSYDYDAPMDETGNPSEKYFIFREAILKFRGLKDEDVPVPPMKTFVKYPTIQLKAIDTILSQRAKQFLATRPFKTNQLMTFEQLDQFSGFVLYETTLPKLTRDPSNLVVSDLRDRALVYIDDEYVGALSRENNINTLPISAGYGSKLSILVENQGRINFQIADDYKGIRDHVKIQTFDANDDVYHTFNEWEITGYPFDVFEDLEHFIRTSNTQYTISNDGNCVEGPVVFHGELEISGEPSDTWWDTTGWGKGFIYVNGFNLGRYWPLAGPQITMYIPKELLKNGVNTIDVVELQKYPRNRNMNFVDKAYFNREESD